MRNNENDKTTTTNKNDNKKNNWNYLNAKTRYGRLHLPDIFGSEQLSAILGTTERVVSLSCVRMLRLHCEDQRTGDSRFMMIIIVILNGKKVE